MCMYVRASMPLVRPQGVEVVRREYCNTIEQYNRYGRDFFVPRGFTYVPPTADDLARLTHEVQRCASCASMRYRGL